MLLAVMVII